MNIDIYELQAALSDARLDGWLVYDFKGSNKIALSLLGLSQQHMTRRFFYWLPKQGEPVLIAHRVEIDCLSDLPGKRLAYCSWDELNELITKVLKGMKQICMETSPFGMIPYLSKLDAGTYLWLSSFGIEIVPSANILATQIARWNEQMLKTHLMAASFLQNAVLQAYRFAHEQLYTGRSIGEYEVQQYLVHLAKEEKMHLDAPPIVAVSAHSANPHYIPHKNQSAPIRKGDWLLIDMWCRQDNDIARHADICRVAFFGQRAEQKQKEAFDAVVQAQQSVFRYLQDAFCKGQELQGADLDRVSRASLEKSGYGNYLKHRLGHSIDREDHGDGTHLDSYENMDNRPIMTRTCFAVEPAVYFDGEFGVRLESNVYITSKKQPVITGGIQKELYHLDPSQKNISLVEDPSPINVGL